MKDLIRKILNEEVPSQVRRRFSEYDRIFKQYRKSFLPNKYRNSDIFWNMLMEVSMETLYHAWFSKTVSDDDWDDSSDFISEYLTKKYKDETEKMWEKKHRKRLNESKTINYPKLINDILSSYKEEDFICDIDVSYYNEVYEIAVKIDKKEFEKKYEKENIDYATILMTGYLDRLKRNITRDIKTLLPVDVLVWFRQINCDKKINESEDNESKTPDYNELIYSILERFKEEDCICDTRVSFDVEENYYDIYLVFSQKELHEKFFNVVGIRSYIQKMMNEVKMELESFLPIRNVFIGNYTKPNCEWSPLNESEDDKEKKIQKNLKVINELISMFDYSEVCDMWVEYNSEDGDYEIKSKMSTKNHNTSALEKEFEFLENSIKYLGFTNCYVFRPYYVEQCEDEIKYMNESEDKNQSLLSLIEENGLYELISSTGLHINEIEQKVGQFSREVLERFIIDVVKEHHTDIDEDGQTYILDLEEYFDVVPIGNNDYVVQLRVMYDKLFFLVDLYDEDEYGDLEYSSHEVEPSKNILYDNIYEIAGQLGFLLVKGRF